MNILDAIKSGKPFKRKHWDIYYVISEYTHKEFNTKDIVAEDWVVENGDEDDTQLPLFDEDKFRL